MWFVVAQNARFNNSTLLPLLQAQQVLGGEGGALATVYGHSSTDLPTTNTLQREEQFSSSPLAPWICGASDILLVRQHV